MEDSFLLLFFFFFGFFCSNNPSREKLNRVDEAISSLISLLQDTLMMGADCYQTESEIASLLAEGNIPIGIGRNTKIR